MKFICLGYIAGSAWADKSEAEQKQMTEECFAYEDELRRGGHFAGGEALQGPGSAVTLRYRNGTVDVTDGPYAETREQIGGILILEARDMNHAIQLMSKHPGVGFGPFEIRPADEIVNALVEERNARFKQ